VNIPHAVKGALWGVPVAIVLIVLVAAATGGSSNSQPAKSAKAESVAKAKANAKLAPEKTAKRIMRDYRSRGVSGKVTCRDFDTTTQLCSVRDHGKLVARLKVKLSVDSGALDVQPEAVS
jgi:hypothetical protein